MSDLSPFVINVTTKGVTKLLDAVKGYLGVTMIRPTAQAELDAKLLAAKTDAEIKPLAAKTDAEVRLIGVRAEIEEEKLRVRGEHEVRTLKKELRAKALPAPVEDLEIDIVYVPEPVEITVVEAQQKPFEFVERKRLKNINAVAKEALKALPEHTEVADENADPDWFARFFDNVKDVSSEHMQRLWGRLLAGEIASPGKFSLRTLDVLRNLNSAEAQLFHRYLTFCTNQAEIVVPHDIMKPCQIDHNDLITLVEAGLLNPGNRFTFGHETRTISMPLRRTLVQVRIKGELWADKDKTWSGMAYRLTKVGLELANVNLPPADKDFVKALCESARKKGFEVEITENQPPEAAPGDAPKSTTPSDT